MLSRKCRDRVLSYNAADGKLCRVPFSSFADAAPDFVEDGVSNPPEDTEMPPPLPMPKYSVQKRVLPSQLVAMSSPEGRKMLIEALSAQTAESYWPISEHFQSQSEPAYCGITTLVVVLNAMGVDPNIRWKGGWRFFGSEDVLLDHCCWNKTLIQRKGITMQDFSRLASCQGLGSVVMKRPCEYSVDQFRDDVRDATTTEAPHPFLVVSFERASLGQTGDGHFSPIAAYHEESDRVLVMDVARFKYPPYWVKVDELYASLIKCDPETEQSRGWFLLEAPRHADSIAKEEVRRPAHLVSQMGQTNVCPMGEFKKQYCNATQVERWTSTKR